MVCLSLLGYLPPSTPTLHPKHLTLEIWTHYKWWWVLHSAALIESLTGTLLPCFYSQPLFQTLQTNVPWKCEKSLFHTFEESHKVIDFQQRSPRSYFVLKLCLKCPLLVLQTELWRGERRVVCLGSWGWVQVVQSQHQSVMGGTRGYKMGNWTPRSQSDKNVW